MTKDYEGLAKLRGRKRKRVSLKDMAWELRSQISTARNDSDIALPQSFKERRLGDFAAVKIAFDLAQQLLVLGHPPLRAKTKSCNR
ncbi:hypothetical protein GCM10009583_36800 [Ornithinicoccus hortensis]